MRVTEWTPQAYAPHASGLYQVRENGKGDSDGWWWAVYNHQLKRWGPMYREAKKAIRMQFCVCQSKDIEWRGAE